MSEFANPASGAGGAAGGYVSALLRVLDRRDPLEVLRELEPALRGVATSIAPEDAATPESPGKWSVAAVVRHLADTEIVFGFRVRMALSHDEPPIAGFDQDLWADHLGYEDAPMEDSLDQLGAVRRANVRLLERLGPEELARAGIHAERGRETVFRMMQLAAAHDLVHRRQIERIRAALTRE